jgi:hypothetical protein
MTMKSLWYINASTWHRGDFVYTILDDRCVFSGLTTESRDMYTINNAERITRMVELAEWRRSGTTDFYDLMTCQQYTWKKVQFTYYKVIITNDYPRAVRHEYAKCPEEIMRLFSEYLPANAQQETPENHEVTFIRKAVSSGPAIEHGYAIH